MANARTWTAVVVQVVTVASLAACGGSSDGSDPADSITPSATGSVASGPYVVGDCKQATEQPREIIVTCADADFTLVDIEYSEWGHDQAEGTAVVAISQGDDAGRYSGTFSLRDPKMWHGKPVFSTAVIRYDDGAGPGGLPEERRDLTSTWVVADNA